MILPLGIADTKRGDEMKTSPLFRKVEEAFRKGKDYLFRQKVASVGPDERKPGEIEMEPVCFRRVEEAIRKGKDHSFDPRVLSVGPHNHGKRDLQKVEDLKVEIHAKFSTEDMVENVPNLIKEKFFYWYPEYIQEKYRSNLESFVDMCVKDACFALYIIDACAANRKPITLGKSTFENCITDLLLLENQLPWPLLDMMNTMKFGEKKGKENVIKFLYAAMNRRLSDSFSEVPKKLFDNALHLVGLLRGLCLMDYSPPGKYPFLAYSAQELDKGSRSLALSPKRMRDFWLVAWYSLR